MGEMHNLRQPAGATKALPVPAIPFEDVGYKTLSVELVTERGLLDTVS